MISAADAAWRDAWKANIQRRARVEVPALLRSAHTQRLQPVVIAPEPLTPLPHTGAMRRLDTEMISAVKLLPIDVRETRELVSSAVRWFFHEHGFFPTVVAINPVRRLALDSLQFFPLDDACAELGCYTVEVLADDTTQIACDMVWCQDDNYFGCFAEKVTEFYL